MSMEKHKCLSIFLLIAATSQVFAVGAFAEEKKWSDGPEGVVIPPVAAIAGGSLTREAFRRSSELHGDLMEAETKASINRQAIEMLEKDLAQLHSELPVSPTQIERAERTINNFVISQDEVLRADLVRLKILDPKARKPTGQELDKAEATLKEAAKDHPAYNDIEMRHVAISDLRGKVLQFEKTAAELRVGHAKATRAGSILGMLTIATVGAGVGEISTGNHLTSTVSDEVSKGLAILAPSGDDKPKRPTTAVANAIQ